MSKGLKALERLMKNYYKMCVIDNCNDDMYQKFNNSSERGIIEKELKALNIILRKGIDINALRRANNCAEYNSMAKSCIGYTQEEYETILGVYYE